MFKRITTAATVLAVAVGIAAPAAAAPAGIHALKGLPPSVAGASTAKLATVNYFYNAGQQTVTGNGIYANVSIDNPYMDPTDHHSLAEISAQSSLNGTTRNIVELGKTNETAVCGAAVKPCLFVYSWKNGVGRGYNSSNPDYVDYAPTALNAGASLAGDVGTVKKLGIQYVSTGTTGWWVTYNNQWIGYFPTAKWTSPAFTQSNAIQAFGEIASSHTAATTCTDMGNGLLGTTAPWPSSARFSSVNKVVGTTLSLASLNIFNSPSNPTYWTVWQQTVSTFGYGGPGAC